MSAFSDIQQKVWDRLKLQPNEKKPILINASPDFYQQFERESNGFGFVPRNEFQTIHPPEWKSFKIFGLSSHLIINPYVNDVEIIDLPEIFSVSNTGATEMKFIESYKFKERIKTKKYHQIDEVLSHHMLRHSDNPMRDILHEPIIKKLMARKIDFKLVRKYQQDFIFIFVSEDDMYGYYFLDGITKDSLEISSKYALKRTMEKVDDFIKTKKAIERIMTYGRS